MKYRLMLKLPLATVLICCIILWAPIKVNAQSQRDNAATFNHFAICTADLKKCTAFYTGLLQIKVIKNPIDTLHQWFNIGPGLALHAIQANCPPAAHDISTHLCFSVASLPDFIKRLEQFNIAWSNFSHQPKTVQARPDGVKQVYFQDPDGYWIEVNDAK